MTRYSPGEVALLGTAPDAKVAKRIGRSAKSVETARCWRGIPGYRADAAAQRWRKFDPLLGTMPDTLIAKLAGVSDVAVVKRRRKLGVAAYRNRNGRVG